MSDSHCRMRADSTRVRAAVSVTLYVCVVSLSLRSVPAEDVSDKGTRASAKTRCVAIESRHLPNAHQIHERVIFGGEPHGAAAFADLKKLGVKTIISVDGLKPDVATAGRFGLRYVHLPHGYDGIPHNRARELAKAVATLPGPIYIHCHHGKHRSPAAAVVASVGAGLLSESAGSEVLRVAGTSRDYQGLFRSVAQAAPVSSDELDAMEVEFRETIEPPATVSVMNAMDAALSRLERLAKNRWRVPADDPDLSPAHEALLLMEHFVEFGRVPKTHSQPELFREILGQSRDTAKKLHSLLKDDLAGLRSGEESATRAAAAVSSIRQQCRECHRKFRN